MTPTWNNVDEVINQIRVTDNHDHIYVVICKWRQDQYNHDVHPALPLSPLLLREDRLDLVDTVVMLPSSFLMTNFCRVSRSDRVPAPLQTPRRERRQLLWAQWSPASFKIFIVFWFLWERHSSANDWSTLTIWESSSSWHDGLPDDPPCQYTSKRL